MKKAVVVGGGVAGLASAQVLSKYFEEVIVYSNRMPVQSQHLHTLLLRGQRILESIFPGILADLIHHDCPSVDWAQDTVWINSRGTFPRYPSTVKALAIGRELLQRRMLHKLNPKIVMKFETAPREISADLIVKACGVQTKMDGDYKESVFPVDLTYRSYVFQTEDLQMQGPKQIYYQIDPPYSHIGGVVCPIGEGKTIVTLIEHEKKLSPCKNFSDFQMKAELIPEKRFAQIFAHARPVSKLSVFRKSQIYSRTFRRTQEKTIILGDSLTSLNPVFGQGMTVSLMQVQALEELLDKKEFSPDKFLHRCQKIRSTPGILSLIGSYERGCLKFFLRAFLRLCQRSPYFHHQFLKKLHVV